MELYDGQQVSGPSGLRTALLRYEPQFLQTFIEKLMTYATGRGMEYSDMPTIRAIARQVSKDGSRFSAIAKAIVASRQFQMRVPLGPT